MTSEIHTARDILNLWPSRKEVVSDLEEQGFDLKIDRVHKWAQLGSIPAKYHQALLLSAAGRAIALTAEQIAQVHYAPDRSPVPSTNQTESSHDQSQNHDAA